MASGAKIALLFALMAAMAMAAQAGTHNVNCTNNYCKPITVNGVTIGAGLTVAIPVDNVLETLTCTLTDIFGKVVVSTCSIPSEVTAIALDVIVGVGIVVKVVATLPILLGTILGNITLSLAVCL